MQTEVLSLSVVSRRSPLALAQVEEVLKELKTHHHFVQFHCLYLDTLGDKDQKTSLRTLDKTDFFTKELDEFILAGSCRIAIHSAKDLPHPLPKGLSLIALTKGLDPADSLVLKEGKTFSTLTRQPLIATSSVRREEAVKMLIPEARFTDIRGTIHKRLEILNNKNIDGVVIAEAALIRLNLTHLNRIFLPGPTTPLQGQVAVVAQSEDQEMHSLFSCMDWRCRE